MCTWCFRSIRIALPFAVLCAASCTPQSRSTGTPVADAWRNPRASPSEAAMAPTPLGTPADSVVTETSAYDLSPLVEVNGSRLSRDQFVNVLLQSHGLELLESVIVLEAARQLAVERGIEVTRADVEATRDETIANLAGPAATTQPTDDRKALGQRILNLFLREKRIGLAEWMIGIERATYLRKLAEDDVTVSEADLQAEYDRRYSEKVQVRHIQLATLDEVEEVRGLLAVGNRFETLARQYSQNDETAVEGGLLPPFAKDDPDLPKLFVLTAFNLQPDEVSDPIREGTWYHLIRLERRFPPSQVEFRHVRDELAAPTRERLVLERMQQIGRRLFRDAEVRIFDAELDQRFRERHADRG